MEYPVLIEKIWNLSCSSLFWNQFVFIKRRKKLFYPVPRCVLIEDCAGNLGCLFRPKNFELAAFYRFITKRLLLNLSSERDVDFIGTLKTYWSHEISTNFEFLDVSYFFSGDTALSQLIFEFAPRRSWKIVKLPNRRHLTLNVHLVNVGREKNVLKFFLPLKNIFFSLLALLQPEYFSFILCSV